MTTPSLVEQAPWRLEGQLVEASNAVFRLVDDTGARAVYKPVRGERPLSDFPPGTLPHREVATWLVADAAGWSCVPETVWFDGDFGPGSLQRWVGPLEPEDHSRVDLLDAQELEHAQGMHAIAAFEGEEGDLVLVHTDDAELRRIALLDVMTNNADRKGSHLIETPDGLYAIDNGLTFHVEDKLRTVLWGFAGQSLNADETDGLTRLVEGRGALRERLLEHLTSDEIDSFHRRTDELLAARQLPAPPQERYALPWPPL